MTKSEKTLWQKKKLLILINFFFCHIVFKKLSAADTSQRIFMRERVSNYTFISGDFPLFQPTCFQSRLLQILSMRKGLKYRVSGKCRLPQILSMEKG